jgi:hypothetical protein
MPSINSNKKQSMLPGGAEYHVQEGIKFHELGKLEQATEQFRLASNLDLPIGMFLYGISLRHGWVRKKNRLLYLCLLTNCDIRAVEKTSNLHFNTSKRQQKRL